MALPPAKAPGEGSAKAELRRHFRRLRRQSLPAAAAGLLAVARRELPPRLSPKGRTPPGRRPTARHSASGPGQSGRLRCSRPRCRRL